MRQQFIFKTIQIAAFVLTAGLLACWAGAEAHATEQCVWFNSQRICGEATAPQSATPPVVDDGWCPPGMAWDPYGRRCLPIWSVQPQPPLLFPPPIFWGHGWYGGGHHYGGRHHR